MKEIWAIYTWTSFNGTKHRVSSPRQHVRRQAISMGWTPPRWWQWWRRKDQPRR